MHYTRAVATEDLELVNDKSDENDDDDVPIFDYLVEKGCMGPKTACFHQHVTLSNLSAIYWLTVSGTALYLLMTELPAPMVDFWGASMTRMYLLYMCSLGCTGSVSTIFGARAAVYSKQFKDSLKLERSMRGKFRTQRSIFQRPSASTSTCAEKYVVLFLDQGGSCACLLLLVLMFALLGSAVFRTSLKAGTGCWALFTLIAMYPLAWTGRFCVMELFESLSENLVHILRSRLRDKHHDRGNTDEPEFWYATASLHRAICESMQRLWSIGYVMYGGFFLGMLVGIWIGVLGFIRATRRRDDVAQVSCAVFILMHTVLALRKLQKLTNITEKCMSAHALSGSILSATLQLVGCTRMSVREQHAHHRFLVYLTINPMGVRMGVFLNRTVLVRVAGPTITGFVSLISYALSYLEKLE